MYSGNAQRRENKQFLQVGLQSDAVAYVRRRVGLKPDLVLFFLTESLSVTEPWTPCPTWNTQFVP